MDGVAIRDANRADRTELVAFHQALYITYRDEILDPELAPLYAYRDLPAALREDVDALLQNPQSIVLVMTRGDTIIGYITGHVEHDPRRVLTHKGVVEDWFVVPEERKTGAGAELMAALTERFRARGCTVMESMTWPFNKGGRAAHDALGFHEIEIRYRKRI